jgi:transcriptional regulator with XRE-family HTH domain
MPPVETARPDGPKIRELIRANGYSVSGFGRAIGRHPQTISDIVRKNLVISLPLLFQVARGLHVKPGDISDYVDDEKSEPEPKVPAA